jgi:shikimate dehydrogenase
MTDRYAVIGNPVSHSKSPLIHAAFARATGEDLSYAALHAEIPDFESVVRRFRDEGGLGVNVTVPFKHRAHALAERLSARAELAQAVNTLDLRAGAIAGDNTDGVGLIRDLTLNLGCALRGRRVLLLGAGGASYGVCGPLLDEEPAALVVANRTVEKAVGLVERFRERCSRTDLRASSYVDLESAFDVVINATSAGLANEMPPLRAGVFGRGAIAYDMVYGRATPFLEFGAAQRARTADGLGMLVEQAAESFHVWRGVRPQTAPVIAMLRAAR